MIQRATLPAPEGNPGATPPAVTDNFLEKLPVSGEPLPFSRVYIRNQREGTVFRWESGIFPVGLTPISIGGNLNSRGEDSAGTHRSAPLPGIGTTSGREGGSFFKFDARAAFSPVNDGRPVPATVTSYTAQLGAEVDHGFLRKHDDRPEHECPRLFEARMCRR